MPEDPPKDKDLVDLLRPGLQEGLRYIDEAAKRKITPRTEEFLRRLGDTHKFAFRR